MKLLDLIKALEPDTMVRIVIWLDYPAYLKLRGIRANKLLNNKKYADYLEYYKPSIIKAIKEKEIEIEVFEKEPI